jgi:hypothetical protein
MIKLNVTGTLLLVTIVMSLFTASVIACDASCKKVSVRALKQYGNKVEQAEDRSCKVELINPRSFSVIVKSCKKALRYLNIRYDGYSDLIKSNPEIEKIRITHLDLQNKLVILERLATAETVKKSISKKSNLLDKFF